VAPPRRCNRAGDHALAFFEADYARTQLLDDADRLVPDRQTLGYGIFALENVNVGSADGCGGDSDQRILRAVSGIGLSSRTIRPFSAKMAAFIILPIIHHLTVVDFWRPSLPGTGIGPAPDIQGRKLRTNP
jgi:hypothetical protein